MPDYKLDILPLVTEDETLGFYSEGHHDPIAFCDAAIDAAPRWDVDLADLDAPLIAANVKHVWWREEAWPDPEVSLADADYTQFVREAGPGEGIFPATVIYIDGREV